jgi:hypothetical protein
MVGAIIQAVAQTTQVITNAANSSADRKQERLNLQYEATKDKQQFTPTQDYTNYVFWGLGILGAVFVLAIVFKKEKNL